jgi:hypothetical protein
VANRGVRRLAGGLAKRERAAITEALIDARRAGKIPRRHPAEVTSDRLGAAVSRWGHQFTPEERDMVGVIRHRLEQIAEAGGSRG